MHFRTSTVIKKSQGQRYTKYQVLFGTYEVICKVLTTFLGMTQIFKEKRTSLCYFFSSFVSYDLPHCCVELELALEEKSLQTCLCFGFQLPCPQQWLVPGTRAGSLWVLQGWWLPSRC